MLTLCPQRKHFSPSRVFGNKEKSDVRGSSAPEIDHAGERNENIVKWNQEGGDF